MDVRALDGDAPATIAVLLPGFRETMRRELPADPPVTAELLARLLQRRHGADRILLVAFDGAEPAGIVKLGLDLADPDGPGHGSLWVFPGFRRRGYGRALVDAALAALRERGRGPLLVDAPQGKAADGFAALVGARCTAVNARNRLVLRGPAHAALGAAAARPVPGHGLRRWAGRCPDDLVDSYARTWGALDARVNGQAKVREPTVEDVRAREAEAERAGHRQYVTAAVRTDGDVVAYSTLYVRASPMADTGETFVVPDLRRRSLATWVKADLLLTAARENAHLAVVQAFNETTNAAVIALNRRLGFKADSHWATYALADLEGSPR
ncbi:GNAT family N-acetyltransferase [Streptomyces hyaluromycini]|uniref:GNAT family N-acetyltransferase n=1 Tax=Streptomyces hyaluromycini TaxID=1377993 RepID=UPI000B5CEE6B|nr:GNAT family N-acetyltransferase [Streptomyces hyaluromycini]